MAERSNLGIASVDRPQRGNDILAWARVVTDSLNKLAQRINPTPPKAERGKQDRNPFEVYEVTCATTNFCRIGVGWVIEQVPQDGVAAEKYWVPELGGVPLNATTAPTLTFASGDWIYCKILTDAGGLITTTPTIVTDASDKDGAHYIPTAPASADEAGVTGEHWCKLAKITVASGHPKITAYQQSDIEWSPYVWTGYNTLTSTTNAGQVYRRYDKTNKRHEFRAIEPIHGSTAALVDGPQLQVRTPDEHLNISGNGVDYDVFFTEVDSTSIAFAFFFRDGLLVEIRTDGTTSPPGSMTAAANQVTIDLSVPNMRVI